MITPIHRIPSSETLVSLFDVEEIGDSSAIIQIESLIRHLKGGDDEFPTEIDENHFSILMDWAMQLRETSSRSWGECIELAATLYLG